MSRPNTQSVLCIDASPEAHELLSTHLQGERLRLLHAQNASEGIAIARQELPDLILVDLALPGTNGLTLCRRFKDDRGLQEIPVILVTSNIETATKTRALEHGAIDYLPKPFDAVDLRTRTRLALQIKQYRDLLSSRARIDALTGLWHHDYLDEQLEVEVSVAQRYDRPVSLVIVDLDAFKAINLTHGRPFADTLLKRIAATFAELSRDSDLVCRYRGAAFALLLRHTSTAGAVAIIHRLRHQLAELDSQILPSGQTISASFGIAGSDQFTKPQSLSPENLLAAADYALQEAKSAGGNQLERARVSG